MNFKELLLPVSFALLVAFGINLYLSRKAEKNDPAQASVSGQMHEVTHDIRSVAPLNWNIERIESDEQQAQSTTVLTNYGQLVFNSAGACLDRLVFTSAGKLLTAIEAKNVEQKTFLVAFENKTPYLYTLAEQAEDGSTITLTYNYQLPGVLFTKIFVIHKQVPQIDLTIKIDAPKEFDSPKKLRIFYPSPSVAAINASEITTFVNDKHKPTALKMYYKLNEVLYKTWEKPTIFGAADKFFVHAFVKDHDALIYRGAFNAVNDEKELLVQLETNEITHAGQWKLSFYFGPKQLSFLNAVDPRLEQTLDYGFWSPLAKLMLWILEFLHRYLKNYGLAIIVFTLIFQLILLPLGMSSQKKMEEQAEMSRKMTYLKHKYRNDPERLKQEQAELIRTHGVGGMFGGCLLMLIQAPIFLALSRLLSSCFQLHQERFLWIPDLATYDPWFILPILSFVTILLRTHNPGKPFTQQLTTYAVALLLGAVTTKLPAGLVLFILGGTLVNLLQTYLLKLKKA